MDSESNRNKLEGDEFRFSKKCFVVLGMHRSGTSCLTGCLQEAGLAADNVDNYNNYNSKGNRENVVAQRINRDLLNENKSAWDNPIGILKSNQNLADKRDQFVEKMNNEHNHWVMKDPRLLLTLPFWKKSLPVTQFLGTFRHPLKVALSLLQRDNLSIKKSLSLWIHYNQKLLLEFQSKPFPIICFDLKAEEYKAKLRQILIDVKAKLKSSEPFNIEEGLKFYHANLLHQIDVEVYIENAALEFPEELQLYSQCIEVYKKLLDASGLLSSYTSQTANSMTLIPIATSLKVYDAILSLQPQNADVMYMKGILHESNKEYDFAIQFYQEAILISPNHYWVFLRLGALYEKMNLWDSAMECYTTAQKQHPLNISFTVLLSKVYLKINDTSRAIHLLTSLSKTHINDIATVNELTNALVKEKRIDEAMDILQNYLENKKIDADWLNMKMGHIEREQKNWLKSKEIFEKLAATSTNNRYQSIAWDNIATLYLHLEEYEKAIQAAHKSLAIIPNNFTAFNILSRILLQKKNYEKALKFSNTAIKIDDSNFSVYPPRVLTQIKLKDFKGAEDSFQKGISLTSDNPHFLAIGANIAFHLKNYDVAIDRYQKAIEFSHPNLDFLYFNLARIKELQDHLEEAVVYLKKAILLSPDNVTYQNKLAEISKS